MEAKAVKLIFAFSFILVCQANGQPIIPEDRMYLRVSPDVIKLEHDTYLPNIPGKQPTLFIRWIYEYTQGLVIAEKSFLSSDLTKLDSEKLFDYNSEGKVIRASTHYPSLPALNSHTTYEYNAKGMLIKRAEVNTSSGEVYRIDTYLKYKNKTSYEQASQFFNDDNKRGVKYISVYENGLKQRVIYKNGFPPVHYAYDSTGNLISRNVRQFFYKLDVRGNAIAAVEIERGMRIYHFIKITYSDGVVTGSLEPDHEFIQKWDNQK